MLIIIASVVCPHFESSWRKKTLGIFFQSPSPYRSMKGFIGLQGRGIHLYKIKQNMGIQWKDVEGLLLNLQKMWRKKAYFKTGKGGDKDNSKNLSSSGLWTFTW